MAMAGCATMAPIDAIGRASGGPWSGRLALRVDADPVRNLSAGFELSGTAQNGELRLFSPLGNTVSSLSWTPISATLRANGESRNFDSLDDLSRELTGAAIPLAALFQWLAGVQANSPGWDADLGQLAAGRLTARRTEPAPAAELRVLLDR